MDPVFFLDGHAFRKWLEDNHASADELLMGFWKKETGKGSIDWPTARDEALCFGWIDRIRKSLGDDSYTIRFTPRRSGSIWSKVNIERFGALKAKGQMTPAGEKAYEDNKEKSGLYSYERETAALSPIEEAAFRQEARAWADWEKRAPSYRKAVLHWVTSAKRPETRSKRLAALMKSSAAGDKIPGYDIGTKK